LQSSRPAHAIVEHQWAVPGAAVDTIAYCRLLRLGQSFGNARERLHNLAPLATASYYRCALAKRKGSNHLAVAGATLLGRCVTRVLFVHAQVDGIRLGRAAGGNATSIASSLLAALTYFVPLDVTSGEETSETHWF